MQQHDIDHAVLRVYRQATPDTSTFAKQHLSFTICLKKPKKNMSGYFVV